MKSKTTTLLLSLLFALTGFGQQDGFFLSITNKHTHEYREIFVSTDGTAHLYWGMNSTPIFLGIIRDSITGDSAFINADTIRLSKLAKKVDQNYIDEIMNCNQNVFGDWFGNMHIVVNGKGQDYCHIHNIKGGECLTEKLQPLVDILNNLYFKTNKQRAKK